ncbi:alpha/beta hydrolase [Quadrisphaera granulorum]|uniref:alpha/beta hydrolase n=1 Tax=Quadrisphaera granulorum TaxID=317664 RepID=UPI0014751017|nr:alpha/beta hydrolase [Quadrisphaera granulorum]
MLTRPSCLLAVLVVLAALLVPGTGAAARTQRPETPVALDASCAASLPHRLGADDARGLDVLGCGDGGGADPRGRVVVAVGDLASAAHVVVLVPGCDSDLASLTPSPRERRPGGTPLDWAQALAAASGPDTAVVLWIGYDTPVGPGLAAATSGRARAAVPALLAEVRTLRASAPRARSTTVVGHSYGAVVVALAAADLDVDDVVLLGSPGAHATSASDLGTTARVWAATAPTDWVGHLPHVQLGDLGHGTDPASSAFGARPLPTTGVRAHDDYFRPGSASLAALAVVVTGTAG